MNIGGELAFLLQDIEYNSKKDLLDKLRSYRDSLQDYSSEERKQIRPILVVSIQQAFYVSEWELMRYKKYCEYRSNNGKEQNKGSSERAV